MRGKATDGPGKHSENPRIEWETKKRKKTRQRKGWKKRRAGTRGPRHLEPERYEFQWCRQDSVLR